MANSACGVENRLTEGAKDDLGRLAGRLWKRSRPEVKVAQIRVESVEVERRG